MTCPVDLLLGDCVERMRELADESVAAVVTDPPYGLEFMGKEWDRLDGATIRQPSERDQRSGSAHNATTMLASRNLPGAYVAGARMQAWHEAWAVEALRVLKPGGYLLAFGGTRTYHRLACALEDAGFEIRDTLAWMFGSGFPKSRDVAKAIDGRAGAEGGWRQEDHPGRSGPREASSASRSGDLRIGQLDHRSDDNPEGLRHVYEPETEEARRWRGWGTALKPAFEPVVVARKPLAGTVAENVERYGTGAINVDGCRIGFAGSDDRESAFPGGATTSHGAGRLAGPGDAQDVDRSEFTAERADAGRWPANVVLGHSPGCELVGTREVRGDGNWSGATDAVGYEGGWDTSDHPRDRRVPAVETQEVWECVEGCPVRMLDEQSGIRTSGKTITRRATTAGHQGNVYGAESRDADPIDWYGDTGGASRFFYVAKTSRAERNAGLGDDFEARTLRWSSGDESPGTFQSDGTEKSARNHHPTVKPLELMRWLIRLVCPPGGVVLDPFLGSGSTGCAATLEPCVGRFVGVERDPEYLAIAEARVAFWAEHGEAALDVVRAREQGERRRQEVEDAGQLDLFGAGA